MIDATSVARIVSAVELALEGEEEVATPRVSLGFKRSHVNALLACGASSRTNLYQADEGDFEMPFAIDVAEVCAGHLTISAQVVRLELTDAEHAQLAAERGEKEAA